MPLHVHEPDQPGRDADRLEYARQVIRSEAAALEQVAGRLGPAFLRAIDLLFGCTGRACLTGTGKSAGTTLN